MPAGLAPLGIRTPDGFATTVEAYRAFLRGSNLEPVIEDSLRHLDVTQIERLQAAGARVRSAILAAEPPSALVQETYLNIHGEVMLVDAVKRCYASLFTDRAIVYRVHHGFDQLQVALSAGVQKMVRSDLACAGVMFSIDTETGFANAVLINGAYGLGESVVQGTVNPDEFYVFKPRSRRGSGRSSRRSSYEGVQAGLGRRHPADAKRAGAASGPRQLRPFRR